MKTNFKDLSDDKLNEAAAKALGWKLSDYHGTEHFYLIPEEHGLKLLHTFSDKSRKLNAYPGEMHFHDSFDWTMLGVKECNNKDLFVHIGYTHIEMGDNCGDALYYRDALDEFPSPQQITQAWVKILEAQNE